MRSAAVEQELHFGLSFSWRHHAALRAALTRLAATENARAVFRAAFGNGFCDATLATILQSWRLGRFDDLPEFRLVEDSILLGHPAAYAASLHAVLLAQGWMDHPGTHPQAVLRVLLEEVGHGLDTILNEQDTPGDEGALFAALVMGDCLSVNEFAAMRAERGGSVSRYSVPLPITGSPAG